MPGNSLLIHCYSLFFSRNLQILGRIHRVKKKFTVYFPVIGKRSSKACRNLAANLTANSGAASTLGLSCVSGHAHGHEQARSGGRWSGPFRWSGRTAAGSGGKVERLFRWEREHMVQVGGREACPERSRTESCVWHPERSRRARPERSRMGSCVWHPERTRRARVSVILREGERVCVTARNFEASATIY
jgi:hypothetical protein